MSRNGEVPLPRPGVRHPRRLEDPLPHDVVVVLAGHRFDDRSQDDVAGVGVLLVRSGLEFERIVDEQGEEVPYRADSLLGPLPELRSEDVPQPGAVLQEVAEGDLLPNLGARIARQVLAHGVVEGELPFFRELVDDEAGEELGDRSDVELRVRPVGHLEGELGHPVRLPEEGLAVFGQQDDSRKLVRRHPFLDVRLQGRHQLGFRQPLGRRGRRFLGGQAPAGHQQTAHGRGGQPSRDSAHRAFLLEIGRQIGRSAPRRLGRNCEGPVKEGSRDG